METKNSETVKNKLVHEVKKEDREPITVSVFAAFFIITFGLLILTS